ncbi:hypothetical protein [Nodularia sphaerocarpa]|uniref:hypothetical protein n=1 Tax=Nodularia sphaerocarpa TaxID=137816 RepID=UPI001EFB5547|nr:hypothetical protein [Nodularia sphaerocarpa]MDB9372667.1 hypothetical protein [Nodularia sphaerocarpa CS-585]MDB9378985.1 hypothetical protein [Nodularia sphaerocarpa CS-585A2]ULP71173.1 hypothetical protein BDGGKGIB_00796 [Nodularia sphaerocarpa UHCC 0038]
MRTDFDFTQKDLVGTVVFRPNFNNFEIINVNQAWSLFFSGGQDDKKLGRETELGRFLTNSLIAIGVTGTLWAIYFNHLA